MEIDANIISRVYSGKPGCMCGCLGEYRDTPRAVKAAVTRMKKVDFKVQLWDTSSDDMGCIYYDTDTRNNVLYIRKGSKLSDELLAKAQESS